MSTARTWNTLSIDESLALRTAATRLATDFDGIFGPQRSSVSCIRRSTNSRSAPPSSSSCR